MTDKKAPAFPVYHGGNARSDNDGMTLRDYFAAKAMALVMPAVLEEIRKRDFSDEIVGRLKIASADACYGMADAMMEAREK